MENLTTTEQKQLVRLHRHFTNWLNKTSYQEHKNGATNSYIKDGIVFGSIFKSGSRKNISKEHQEDLLVILHLIVKKYNNRDIWDSGRKNVNQYTQEMDKLFSVCKDIINNNLSPEKIAFREGNNNIAFTDDINLIKRVAELFLSADVKEYYTEVISVPRAQVLFKKLIQSTFEYLGEEVGFKKGRDELIADLLNASKINMQKRVFDAQYINNVRNQYS